VLVPPSTCENDSKPFFIIRWKCCGVGELFPPHVSGILRFVKEKGQRGFQIHLPKLLTSHQQPMQEKHNPNLDSKLFVAISFPFYLFFSFLFFFIFIFRMAGRPESQNY